MKMLHVLPVLAGLLMIAGPAAADQNRWYSEGQISAGKKIFDRSCAGCHGQSGEASTDWQKKDSDGYLPPPPLNGTGHSWHHPLDALRDTVLNGGATIGGTMPAFKDVLTDGDVDAVIAYVQSIWPDEVYEGWARNKTEPSNNQTPANGSAEPDLNDMTRMLTKLLPPEVPVSKPIPTPITGIYEINANGRIIYLNDEGRYALIGDFVDLETGESLTEAKRSEERVNQISSFPIEDKIVFTAAGKELAHIDVFTDTTCPYCRKLHNEIPQLQAAGVSVRYLPFPRGGEKSKGFQELRSVWCDTDPVQGMHQAKTNQIIPTNDGTCDAGNAVAAGYKLGIAIGVKGTPAIVLPDGRMISGYRPHASIVTSLGIDAD